MKMVNVLHFMHVIDRDECTMRYVRTYGKERFYSLYIPPFVAVIIINL